MSQRHTHTCRLNFRSEPVSSQTQPREDFSLATVRGRMSCNANGVSLSSNDMDGNLRISAMSETQGTRPIQMCVFVWVHKYAPQIKAAFYYRQQWHMCCGAGDIYWSGNLHRGDPLAGVYMCGERWQILSPWQHHHVVVKPHRCATEMKMRAEFEDGCGATHDYWALMGHKGQHVDLIATWASFTRTGIIIMAPYNSYLQPRWATPCTTHGVCCYTLQCSKCYCVYSFFYLLHIVNQHKPDERQLCDRLGKKQGEGLSSEKPWLQLFVILWNCSPCSNTKTLEKIKHKISAQSAFYIPAKLSLCVCGSHTSYLNCEFRAVQSGLLFAQN